MIILIAPLRTFVTALLASGAMAMHLLATCAARCQAGVTPPTQGEKLIVHILFASVSGSSQWLCRGQGVKTKFTIPFARATNKTMGWRNENNRLFLGCTLHNCTPSSIIYANVKQLRQGTGQWTDGWKSFQFPFKELGQLAPAPGTGYWVWRICMFNSLWPPRADHW